jgi:glycosyltransferase involved in cell wall biosynthesis
MSPVHLGREVMYNGKKVVVVMPAYNAAKTVRAACEDVMNQGVVDLIVLVDDASRDETVAIAHSLQHVRVVVHSQNRGYGANQKTCYREALASGADIVVMVHADYQYTPKLIPAMASMIGSGLYHCVLGSRILGGNAVANGMPLWKYVANRALTFFSNLIMGAKLSEYHTGYRAFSRELLEKIPIDANSEDFVFDSQILAQILWLGYTIAEVSCPTRYFKEASSIDFRRSVRYGIGCVITALTFRLAKEGLTQSPLFPTPR